MKSFDIEIEGVILDRGFAVEPVFKAIEDNKWKYVIMLPSNTNGHKKILSKYGDVIRWKSEYIIENDALFGINDTEQLFSNNDRKSNICLYFDGVGGSTRSIKLIKEIQLARKKAVMAISQGRKASIEKN